MKVNQLIDKLHDFDKSLIEFISSNKFDETSSVNRKRILNMHSIIQSLKKNTFEKLSINEIEDILMGLNISDDIFIPSDSQLLSDSDLMRLETFISALFNEFNNYRVRKNIIEKANNNSDENEWKLGDFARQQKNQDNSTLRVIEQIINDNRMLKDEINKLSNKTHSSVEEMQKVVNDKNEELDTLIGNASLLLKDVSELKKTYNTAVGTETSEILQSKFLSRADDVSKQAKYWKYAVYITGAITLIVTGIVIFVPMILEAEGYKFAGDSKAFSIILRSVIAVATYILLGFTIAQYNKEREIEEAYRFKETIAFSIPNFSKIATNDNLKDKLLEESAMTIFSPPYESGKKLKASSKGNKEDISSVFDLLSKAQKLIKGATGSPDK